MRNLKLYFLILPLALYACRASNLEGSNSRLRGSWVKKELHTNLPFVSNAALIDTLIFDNYFKRREVFLLNKNNPYLGRYKIISNNKIWINFLNGNNNLGTGFYLKYAFKDDNNLVVLYNVNTLRGKFYVQCIFRKIQ